MLIAKKFVYPELDQLRNYLTANLPPTVLKSYLKVKRSFQKDPYKDVEVSHKSEFDNIYHCCIQRSGSQWLKAVFADPIIYKYTGLKIYNPLPVQHQKLSENNKDDIFNISLPCKKIISPLYCSFLNFSIIKKPGKFTAFYIIRDPRDLLVSQYFSKKYSHKRSKEVDVSRNKLRMLDLNNGLIYLIDMLDQQGYWEWLHSWIRNAESNNIKIFKYENLTGKNYPNGLKSLFKYLKINIPENELELLVSKYNFKSITGRNEGEESISSHYRKGVNEEWKIYFNENIHRKFKNVTGNLIESYKNLGLTEKRLTLTAPSLGLAS